MSQDSSSTGGFQLPDVLGDVQAEREARDCGVHSDGNKRGSRDVRVLGGGQGAVGGEDRCVAERVDFYEDCADKDVHSKCDNHGRAEDGVWEYHVDGSRGVGCAEPDCDHSRSGGDVGFQLLLIILDILVELHSLSMGKLLKIELIGALFQRLLVIYVRRCFQSPVNIVARCVSQRMKHVSKVFRNGKFS